MKSFDLDKNNGIIVTSKKNRLVELIFVCKNEEDGGDIRTTTECYEWCENTHKCEQYSKMLEIVEQTQKEMFKQQVTENGTEKR